MSKAEKFIEDCTMTCNNEKDSYQTRTGAWVDTYYEWLTPDQARKAVEIARKEVIEKVCEFLDNDLCCYIKAQDFAIEHQRLEYDLIQSIKDE